MRRVPIAVACLLMLGIWAQPAHARQTRSSQPVRPNEADLLRDLDGDQSLLPTRGLRPPPPPGGTTLGPARTFSGTRLLQTTLDSVFLLYPGACYERDAGTWSPRPYAIADSLNTYMLGSTGPYQQVDASTQDRMWHIADASTDAAQRPAILDGSRSLWCGKYNSSWINKVGYPNQTMQILYIDTGSHAAPYTLSMVMQLCSEYAYDYVYLIGGGGGLADPLGIQRLVYEDIIQSGHSGSADLLVSWTGSITTGGVIDVGYAPVSIVGAGSGDPLAVAVSLTNVSAAHRAIYIVFRSDEYWSSEDGLWPFGHGQVLDLIQTSDNGMIYDDQPQSLRPDPPFGPYRDQRQGEVLLGTDVAPIISARVPSGAGELWHLVAGNTVPTPDYCSPQKQLSSDLMLSAADATTLLTVPGEAAEIRTCPLALPPHAWRVDIVSNGYLNLGAGEGFVTAMLRWFRDGQWTAWGEMAAKTISNGRFEAWRREVGTWTAQIYGADSVQASYTLQVTAGSNPALYGILLDDIQLKVYTGSPRPVIWGYGLPQSTFIDGTMTGTNCSTPPCWPGIYGTDRPGGIDDNVNTGWRLAHDGGDGIYLAADAGVRRNGKGVNWKVGYGDPVGGVRPPYLNGSFNPIYDAPRMIYRLFDPGTRTWSSFDSTILAAKVWISDADTVVDWAFNTDWPPPEKLEEGASLPDGFTVNGRSRYSELRYLPRGTRLQYYFKMVDILGGVAHDFGWMGETEDLPLLPGGAIQAPDIFEFDVLPRVYPPGASGTLLAGKTDTPILNLDSGYGAWSAWPARGLDPVTQALRALGVRADRYRAEADLIGGHPFGATEWYVNSWPNLEEYAILPLLANQYRIIIEPSNFTTGTPFDEQTSKLIHAWWDTDTGTNSGDRCIFTSGDNTFAAIFKSTPPGNAERLALMTDVFGVGTVIGTWSGGGSNLYPTLDDRFTGGGPGLAAPNTLTYPIDGGCPNLRRFDGLTKIGSTDAQNAVIFPSGAPDVAGVARMSEMDPVPDTDRNKALSHSFGIERIRAAGIPPTAANYAHSGVQNRMRAFYKFLTSCRGMRNSGTQCWPCPGNAADMTGNWAGASGFETGTYGPLYAIQDPTQATGVDVVEAPGWANRLEGNFPNPFNPETRIRFTAASGGRVVVRVFDVGGRLVSTMVRQVGEAGPAEVRWDGRTSDGRAVSSGVYFYRVRFADGQETASKMMLLR